jgi:hypothetical protein
MHAGTSTGVDAKVAPADCGHNDNWGQGRAMRYERLVDLLWDDRQNGGCEAKSRPMAKRFLPEIAVHLDA